MRIFVAATIRLDGVGAHPTIRFGGLMHLIQTTITEINFDAVGQAYTMDFSRHSTLTTT
jgi:hypothetical protein